MQTDKNTATETSAEKAGGSSASNIQRKLSVGAENDPLEHEADAMADKVMRMPNTAAIQRKSASGPGPGYDDERVRLKPLASQITPFIQTKSKGESTVSDAVSGRIRSSMGGGSQMADGTKSFMESRFGTSFSDVNIHNGEESTQLNRSLNAKAFTVGNNIYFNKGQYQPETDSGKHLLAHELTHVVQQKGGANTVNRKVDTYRTEGINTPDIGTIAGKDYWLYVVGEKYDVTFAPRMNTNAEEKHAVLSAAWAKQPGSVAAASEMILLIPGTNRAAGSKTLMYKAVFKPKDATIKDDKPKLSFTFISEVGTAEAAQALPQGYTTKGHNVTYNDLPDDYFDKFPDAKQQILYWIESNKATDLSSVLTVETTVKTKRKMIKFNITGTKNAKGVFDGTITYLGENVTDAPVSVGYNDKDYGDLEIEKAQKNKDYKLGAVDVSKVPAAERVFVKYMAATYAKKGSNNAEVDVIIPIDTKKVLYTFRYINKTNDVEVERIGELGKEVSFSGVSIQNAAGFAAANTDAAALKTWLGQRYKGLTIKGATQADIIKEADTQLQKEAGTAAWFNKNYGMSVLDSTEGADRWQKTHGWTEPQTWGMKDFTTAELMLLEQALQAQSQPMLTALKGVKFTRQNNERDKKGTSTNSDTAGFTAGNTSERTITIYDRFNLSENIMFVGDKSKVHNTSLMTIVHEMGHAVSFGQTGVEAAFNAFVKKNNIPAVTAYAGTKVNSESFPEAYALFHLDPNWMKTNIPAMYTWFETLSTSGKAP
ncbi:hypothetical protein GCM10023149_14200 [Mucilaginibacter gynuensis]|uniref:eCIS core domain-containing protein n=1 Tax=Mucilaginibacter gynuensis TaxID=1302236 RepID=A0ABP8G4J6_9SPHI